jgi:hypothetical protein
MAAGSQAAPILDLKVLSGGSATLSDVDAHMQRFLKTVRPNAAPAQPDGRAASDPGLAEELIARATKAIDVLVRRCHQLESDAAALAEQTRIREQEQAEAVIQWQKLASGMKSHAQKADKDLTDAKRRVNAAESRAVTAEAHTADLQKSLQEATERAAATEQLSMKLQQLVSKAFGVGSSIDGILERVEVQQERQAATQAA